MVRAASNHFEREKSYHDKKENIFAEKNLILRGMLPQAYKRVFLPDPNQYNRHHIEDDHIPFLREGENFNF